MGFTGPAHTVGKLRNSDAHVLKESETAVDLNGYQLRFDFEFSGLFKLWVVLAKGWTRKESDSQAVLKRQVRRKQTFVYKANGAKTWMWFSLFTIDDQDFHEQAQMGIGRMMGEHSGWQDLIWELQVFAILRSIENRFDSSIPRCFRVCAHKTQVSSSSPL
jgi:hypothetical protein